MWFSGSEPHCLLCGQYTAVLSVLVLLEIAMVVYVYLQQSSVGHPMPTGPPHPSSLPPSLSLSLSLSLVQALNVFRSTLEESIVLYYEDPDKASIIDQLQSQVQFSSLPSSAHWPHPPADWVLWSGGPQ